MKRGLKTSIVHLDVDIIESRETVVLDGHHIGFDRISCRCGVIDFVQFDFMLPKSVEYSHVAQIAVCLVTRNTLSMRKVMLFVYMTRKRSVIVRNNTMKHKNKYVGIPLDTGSVNPGECLVYLGM